MGPLLAIVNEPSEALGVAGEAFRAEGVPVRVLPAFRGTEVWPGVEDVGGIVAFGGGMNADEVERHPFLATERALLGEAIARGVPVLGVCLGSQLLARSLGAVVVRAPVREIGFTPVHPTTAAAGDPLLGGLADGDRVFHWHEDTFDLPADAELLATGDDVFAQAFRVGDRAWGVQFHPEITGPMIQAWAEASGPDLAAKWGKDLDELMQEAHRHLPDHHRRGFELFRAFARLVAG